MRKLIAFALLIASVVAIPQPLGYPDNLYRKHLAKWDEQREAGAQDEVVFWVALKQRNLKALEKIFWEVTDPENPQYTNWKAPEEVLQMIAPPVRIQNKVIRWLKSEGVDKIENFKDAIKVTAKAPAVERLLNTKLFVYQHSENGHTVVRQRDGFTVPSHVSDHVEFISGLTEFPYPKRKTKMGEPEVEFSPENPEQNFQYIIPASVRALYNIPADLVCKSPKTSQSVMEFTPYGAPFFSDMTAFAQQADEIFTNISHIMGPFQQVGEGESTLDVELLYPIGSKAINWYWTANNGWAYEMALELFNNPTVPMVVSVSYGWPEFYTCQTSVTYAHCNSSDTAQTYVLRANNELMKAGLRGISIMIATQDEGAPSEANIDCSLDNTNMPVYAIYPSSSPYVTAVSGTTVFPPAQVPQVPQDAPICAGYGCAYSGYELPCETNNTQFGWTTGGGFSVYGALPSYQAAAVAGWQASDAIKPPKTLYPYNMRGYADVSATGDRIIIYINGAVTTSAGTSASTPAFSGVVTLLNDRRMQQGKKQLGFLNPMLYKMAAARPKAFNDIVRGDNRCTEGSCCTYGYGAAVGWDPTTGLGSPNWPEMVKYIDTLP